MSDDQPEDPKVSLGGVLDGIIGGLTTEQFQQLSERTGHSEVPPKQAAAQALADLVKHGNIAADSLTPAQVLRRIQRRG